MSDVPCSSCESRKHFSLSDPQPSSRCPLLGDFARSLDRQQDLKAFLARRRYTLIADELLFVVGVTKDKVVRPLYVPERYVY